MIITIPALTLFPRFRYSDVVQEGIKYFVYARGSDKK